MTVFGVHVKTFPNGIKKTFDHLVTIFGKNRSYYGISWLDENDRVKYYATVLYIREGLLRIFIKKFAIGMCGEESR